MIEIDTDTMQLIGRVIRASAIMSAVTYLFFSGTLSWPHRRQFILPERLTFVATVLLAIGSILGNLITILTGANSLAPSVIIQPFIIAFFVLRTISVVYYDRDVFSRYDQINNDELHRRGNQG